MLNGAVQSVNYANERSRQTLQPYQSLWLAHWKRTDCDAAGETSIPDAFGREEVDFMFRKDDLTKGLEDSSRSANGLGRIKNRTFETGDDFIKAGRESVGNERMFSSVFKDGQDADDVQVIIPELAQDLECSKAVHNRSGIPWSGCHSVEEDTSDNPPELLRTCSSRKDSLFRINPLQKIFVESSSRALPYNFDVEVDKIDKGKAAMCVGSRQRDADIRMLEHEQCCERNVGSESISCGHSLSMISRGWFMEVQKSSGIRLLTSRSNTSEEYETTKSRNDCYSQLKLQNVHGLGTMTICTAVNVSAESDSMSMDSFKDNKYKNLHSCSNLTESAKTFNMESNEVVPSREVGHGRLNYKLPDINLKPDAASSSENTSPSSSRSLGLETETLVECVKQPKVKYSSSVDEFPNADAGNRWVKRLKLSSSNSYLQGIKSSDFSSSSYDESRSKLFSGILNSNTTSSTPNIETADNKGKALLLSHGWIRRWGRIKSNGNSEVEAIDSPKFAKGQFPSIAAMALMAKALTCSQQCELQKKGSCTIWNTKTI